MCSSVYLFVLVHANVYVGDEYTDMFIKMCFTCLHIILNVNKQYIYVQIYICLSESKCVHGMFSSLFIDSNVHVCLYGRTSLEICVCLNIKGSYSCCM